MKRILSLFLILCLTALLSIGAFAGSGEAGGSSGKASAEAETAVVTLVPETADKLIIGAEAYEFTTDMFVKTLEIDPKAEITSKYPVVVQFEESNSVKNGDRIGNVQFISDYDEVVAIVHTNDVHGHIEVEPYVKGLSDSLKASGDYSLVLTVSAGDVYGGGEAVAGSYNGELIPAILDKVYDIVVPGNNDFTSPGVVRQDLLLSALYEHTQTICANMQALDTGLAVEEYAADYEPVIGAELFDELYEKVGTGASGELDLSALALKDAASGEPLYPSTTVFTTDKGTEIGLFGLTTTGGALAVESDSLGSIATAQECTDALRAAGAGAVIGVGHTGWLGEGATGASSNDTNSWQLADSVTDLDLFIDAHSHSIINAGQGVLVGDDPTFVNQAESFGYCIGVIYLYLKDGEVLAVDGNVTQDVTDIPADEEVQALVDMALAKVKEDFGKPIAHTDYFLNGERLAAGNEGGTVRGNETNLGDLMTDVILAAASEKMGVDYDFCAYPGYWLRASVAAGDITLESIQSVFANPTVLYYDTCTAADIMTIVNKGLANLYPEKEENTFFQYSGLRVTYDYEAGSGTPVTVTVGDTLVYDAAKGGIQVADDWTCEGVLTMTGGEIDSYTGDQANWICHDKTEVQTLVADWFKTHTDYMVFPNTVAPDGRVIPAV